MTTTVTTPTKIMMTTGKECLLHKTAEMTMATTTAMVAECTDVLVTDAGVIVTTQIALHLATMETMTTTMIKA